MSKNKQSRRNFISNIVFGTAGAVGAGSLFSSRASADSFRRLSDNPIFSLSERAPDGKVLKAGLVGCGGRGSGAAVNFIDAGPNLEIVALGDVFQDQVDKCRHSLKAARDIEVADENCFAGFDSYQKVIDSGVDLVILATPPHFRPIHVKAAIEAGKHVFQEKPVAVDPVGARLMAETTERAKEKNLCMVSGTIRRYQKDYVETHRRVMNGEIGEVIGANIIRNGGALWRVERKPEWTDMEYMIRNWANFNWLSGDHIVEMFVHEIDVMSWYVGDHPTKANGYGSRLQRISGDQFDQFSVGYEYGSGRRVHCATRQVNGCDNGRKQFITGTKGYADASGALYNYKDELIWEYPFPYENDDDQTWRVNDPYVQEHIELVKAIRTGNYINDSDEQIKSVRIAIMGRMATYTGREITWDEVLNSELKLGPDRYEFGEVNGIAEKEPVVGLAPTALRRY
ncbi:MAG: Gfo/Idh/MocA family oxidoreductase [Balneolales bacterium]